MAASTTTASGLVFRQKISVDKVKRNLKSEEEIIQFGED
jgi:hypothetical protein